MSERMRNEALEGIIKRTMPFTPGQRPLERTRVNMHEYGITSEEVEGHVAYRRGRSSGTLESPFSSSEEKAMRRYQIRWSKLAISAKRVGTAATEKAIKSIYNCADLPEPLIVWCDSTLQAFLLPLAATERDPEPLLKSLRESGTIGAQPLELLRERLSRLSSTLGALPKESTASAATFFYNKVWTAAAAVRESIESKLGLEKFAALKYEYPGTGLSNLLTMRRIFDQTRSLLESSLPGDERTEYLAHLGTTNYEWTHIGEMNGPAIMYGAALNCLGIEFPPETDPLRLWLELHELAPAYRLCRGVCFVMRRPSNIDLDERDSLHSDLRAAITFADQFKLYFMHGILLPLDLMEDRSRLTIERIESTDNAEVRRLLITLYGPEKFLKESNVNVIHQDEFGILYHKHFHDGVCEAMVCVKNSTPEPDGSTKEYYLRVPPDIHTAKGAVAWTFGLEADEYQPEFES
ncbi:MAG: DUF6745 domain-containing protein [Candidatus Obscuribacterales bacterium]